jgi:hypothetical protein
MMMMMMKVKVKKKKMMMMMKKRTMNHGVQSATNSKRRCWRCLTTFGKYSNTLALKTARENPQFQLTKMKIRYKKRGRE